MLALSRVEGTNGQRKDNLMARSKPSARNALKKLREQREELDAQEASLREEAAGDAPAHGCASESPSGPA